MTKKTVRRINRSTPLKYDWLKHDFVKDPSPLIDALQSAAALPRHLREVLIGLLSHYRFVQKVRGRRKRAHPLLLSEKEATLSAAAEEYRALGPTGRITREEGEAAVRIRAKREGRAPRNFDLIKSAEQLRKERIASVAAEYDVKPKTLEAFLKGKRGASRRRSSAL